LIKNRNYFTQSKLVCTLH